ncbi:type III pantothenate kinase [Halobacteriovorax sp. HFRX-2_2]|uniref:type III pantothenate kinase n=1 Tax=unclassified Halobacteriovorax TaxID=2639665 RepID=UPI0037231531
MLTYTIDSGNTFIKIGIFKGRLLTSIEKLEIANFNFNFEEGAAIIYSNVSKEIKEFLPKDAINALSLITEFNSTYDSKKIGADRKIISRYLQKYYPQEKILLVDAGSFITFDEIDHGLHKGGPIFLGLGNYLKAYPQFSANLPDITGAIDTKALTNTRQAISYAYDSYLNMIVSEIKKFSDHRILVTGGDGYHFKELGEFQENLIHDALINL